MDLSAIAAVISALVAIVALYFAYRSQRASEISAKASEKSADVSADLLALEREREREAKTASLIVSMGDWWGTSELGSLELVIRLSNKGKSAAFETWVDAKAAAPLVPQRQTFNRYTILPDQSVEFAFMHHQFANGLYEWHCTIRYQDGIGDHVLVAIYRLEIDFQPRRSSLKHLQLRSVLDPTEEIPAPTFAELDDPPQ